MQLKKGQVGCNTKKFNNFNLDKFCSLSLRAKCLRKIAKIAIAVAAFVESYLMTSRANIALA